MSININDPELHIKMAMVDAPTRVEATAKEFLEKTHDWSIQAARKEYGELFKRIDEEKDPMEKAYLMENKSTGIVIYGYGGWHRYYVRSDGRVVYSQHHGQADSGRAKEVGFDIQ